MIGFPLLLPTHTCQGDSPQTSPSFLLAAGRRPDFGSMQRRGEMAKLIFHKHQMWTLGGDGVASSGGSAICYRCLERISMWYANCSFGREVQGAGRNSRYRWRVRLNSDESKAVGAD